MIQTPHADFCMIMTGDSMAGAGIKDGDLVCFAACDHVDNGQIAAVRMGEDTYLRRAVCNGMMLVDCPPQGMCSAFYPDEQPDLQIVGKVVQILRTVPPYQLQEEQAPATEGKG